MESRIEDRRLAGGAIAFILLVALVAKALRAYDTAGMPGAWRLLLAWPVTFGPDLLACSLLGILFVALDYRRNRAAAPSPGHRVAVAVMTLLAAGWALLLVGNVLSYRLSGGPITLPRLMGQDGATLGDLDLIDAWDLYPMLALVALLMGAAYPVSARVGRTRLARLLARPRNLAILAAAGAALTAADTVALSRMTFGLSENPLWVFVDDLVERGDEGHLVLDRGQWEQLSEPGPGQAHDPEAPPVPKSTAKNVVVFLGEGFSISHTGFGAQPVDTTPNALRRARNGATFTRFYSTYHKSIHALFSIACSQYPPPSPKTIVQFNPRIGCKEMSLALQERGVASGFFHGGRFKFYDKLSFFGDRGYSVLKDAADMSDRGRWEEDRWGIDDRAAVDAALEWIDSLDPETRFFAFIVPLSPHYPYKPPKDFEKPFPHTGALNQFLNAVRFSDDVFERLMVGLEERGLERDTVVIWMADHGNYVEEPSRETPGLRLFYEPNVHVPFVIINPVLFPEPVVSDRLADHLDILPTILALLGLPPEPSYEGQDLLSPDWRERRVFLAADRGGKRYVAFVEGFHKFVKEIGRSHTEYYDLLADPLELEDLSGDFSDLMASYSVVAEKFAAAQMTRLMDWPKQEERASVQQDVLRSGRFTVSTPRRRISCSRVDGAGVRKCRGFPQRVHPHIDRARVGKKERVCILTHLPEPSGSVEVLVRGDLLRRVSGLRLGILDRFAKKSEGTVKVTVDVDGKREVTTTISGKKNVAELDFRHAGESLKVTLSSTDGRNKPVCLMFSDASWYGRE